MLALHQSGSSKTNKREEGGGWKGEEDLPRSRLAPADKRVGGAVDVGSGPAAVGALARLFAGVARGVQRPGREVAPSAEPPKALELDARDLAPIKSRRKKTMINIFGTLAGYARYGDSGDQSWATRSTVACETWHGAIEMMISTTSAGCW